MEKFKLNIHRLLYDVQIIIGSSIFGIGTLSRIELQYSESSTSNEKDLYLMIINNCNWLFKLKKNANCIVGPSLYEFLISLRFDLDLDTFECSNLIKIYPRYLSENNVRYLISDHFCFTKISKFLSWATAKTKKPPLNLYDDSIDKKFEQELARAGDLEHINFESLNDENPYKYSREILNCLLLVRLNLSEGTCTKVCRIYNIYNKNAEQISAIEKRKK